MSGDSAVDSNFYGEGDISSIANKQIDAFKTSARSHKGFYVGRYEQGKGNVCIAGVEPITEITRDKAKSSAEARYRGHVCVTSELISSYAWDTTLNFICQTNEAGYTLATTRDRKYGNLSTGEMNKTGKYSADKYSNIYDFLGNYWEWTTEYCAFESDHCTSRGGTYFNGYLDSGFFAADRITLSMNYRNTGPPFRMQVYIK